MDSAYADKPTNTELVSGGRSCEYLVRVGPKGQARKPELAGPGPVPENRELFVPNPKLKVLDQMREVMRLRQYSIRTGTCRRDWIRRFIKFQGVRSRAELGAGGVKSPLDCL